MISAPVIKAKGRFFLGFWTSPEITKPASNPPKAKISNKAELANSGISGGELKSKASAFKKKSPITINIVSGNNFETVRIFVVRVESLIPSRLIPVKIPVITTIIRILIHSS